MGGVLQKMIDNCLTPDVNRVETSSITNTTNGNGEYTLSQISVFEKDFRKNISNTEFGNPLTRAVNKYPDFYENLNKINLILDSDNIKERIPKYEVLTIKQTKLGKVSLSPIEFAEYIKDNNLTPITANFIANQNPPKFLQSIDDYLRDGFANSVMGGFCGLMPNVFGAIGAFFGIIGSIDNVIADALSSLNKIRNALNPLLAAFDLIKVQALINKIKDKITKTIMGVINKIQSAVENFSIANVISQVESLVANTVGATLFKLQESIMRFFSEENKQAIVRKLNGMIDYAVGLFDNPSVEEIMFLISRICGFAAGMETLISGLKDPLDTTANQFINGVTMMKSNSGIITGDVVAAGGIRMDDSYRAEMIRQAKNKLVEAGNDEPIPDETYNNIPTWDEIVTQRHPKIRLHPTSNLTREGWEGLTPETKASLILLWDKAGLKRPFSCRSFFRSQTHQDRLYIEMLEKEGSDNGTVAKTSMHTSGIAVDLSWSGFDPYSKETDDFIIVARSLGFNGIIRYNSFLHIDRRSYEINLDFRTIIKSKLPDLQSETTRALAPIMTPRGPLPTDEFLDQIEAILNE